jgi:hypothetical protein
MPSQGEDSVNSGYDFCHDFCVAAAHKCLDQITPSLSQQRADGVRTQCGEKRHPNVSPSKKPAG